MQYYFLSVSGKSQCQELLTFLHVQLAEAINLQDRALSAQLHETIRSVKDLPPQRYNIYVMCYLMACLIHY